MLIDKEQVMNLLRDEGRDQAVDLAGRELPDLIDTERHADHLRRLGLDPEALGSPGGGLTDMFGP